MAKIVSVDDFIHTANGLSQSEEGKKIDECNITLHQDLCHLN